LEITKQQNIEIKEGIWCRSIYVAPAIEIKDVKFVKLR
jgi:hypothetical protein